MNFPIVEFYKDDQLSWHSAGCFKVCFYQAYFIGIDWYKVGGLFL